MASGSARFPTVQLYYPEVDEEVNQLAVVRGAAYPMGNGCWNRPAEPVARAQVANVLLKNELCDLFKELYRHHDWASVLEAALRTGRGYPILGLIANRMRVEVLEEKYYFPSPPSSSDMGGESD